MWSLIRRNPAWDALPRWVVFGVVAACQISGLVFWRLGHQLRHTPEHTWLQSEPIRALVVTAVGWLPLVVYLVFGRAQARCTRLDLVLPLPTRSLGQAHRVAVILAGSICVGMGLALVLFQEWLLGRLFDVEGGILPIGRAHFTLLLLAGMLLAVGLGALSDSQLRVAGESVRARWMRLVVLLAIGLALAGLALLPRVAVLLPLLLALGLLLAGRQRQPLAYVEMPRHGAETVTAPSAGAWSARQRQGLWWSLVLHWYLWRSLMKKPAVILLGAPLLVVFGLLLTGRLYGEMDIDFGWVAIVAYTIVAFFGPAVERLHRLDALPVPRPRLFAVLFLPLLALIVLGYGAGQFADVEPARHLHFVEADDHYELRIDPRDFRIVWDGPPPPLEAPWGERHEMMAMPIVRGLPVMLVKPYTTPAGASIDYVAWQLSRAVERIFGASIPWQEIRDGYLETDADGKVVPQGGTFTLLDDHPELRREESPGRMAPLLLGAVAVSALLAIALMLRMARHSTSLLRIRVAFFGILALLMAAHIAGFVLIILGAMTSWAGGAFVEILVNRLVASMPGPVVWPWIGAALLSAAAYALAVREFERVEAFVLKEEAPR